MATSKSRQEKVVKLFLEGKDIKAVAQEVGIPARTIYDILRRNDIDLTLAPFERISDPNLPAPTVLKSLEILKDAGKYNKEIVHLAREKVLWALESIDKKKIKKAGLTPIVTAVSILMDIAQGKRKFAETGAKVINIDKLQVNIFEGIKAIRKFDAPLAKRLEEEVKKAKIVDIEAKETDANGKTESPAKTE